MKSIQGYLGGMNRDSAQNKRPANSYYSLLNFRVTTEDGLSTGSLETEKGNKLGFVIPNIKKQGIVSNSTGTVTINFQDATPSIVITVTEDNVFTEISTNAAVIALGVDVTVYQIGSTTVIEDTAGAKIQTIIGTLGATVELIAAQSNLQIIGWTTIVDDIIVFTTSETGDSPTSSVGQVWQLVYDEATDSITNIGASNTLVVTEHLRYNNVVNFSSCYRIGRAIGRYENISLARVYWTDNYNSVRTINVADPYVFETPVNNLDLRAGVTFSQPNILSIGTGSLPDGVVAQFAYRQLDTGGAETIYSPVSAMVNLPENSLSSTTLELFEGDLAVINPGSNSVTYNIKGIDTNYDVIEHIVILYTANGIKTIYKFGEEFVNSTGETTVVCSSIAEAIQIPLVEFNMLASGFDKAKDIEVVDNKLIAANTTSTSFVVDFDARAYRFNSSADALLDAGAPITLSGPTPAYASVPDTHDAINTYNDEDNAGWFTAVNQYKFQVDGTTLGGSGANVSYKFTSHASAANFQGSHPTTAPPHIDVNNWGASDGPFNLGVMEADGSLKEIQYGSQLKNNASSWLPNNLAGHTRGEVYRYGMVCYNDKGTVSFVEWIGDIKFPNVDDGFPLMVNNGSFDELQSLGIEFTVDTSSLPSSIKAFGIVRVERKEADKSKLGSGIQMFFDAGNSSSLPYIWEETGPNASILNSILVADDIDIYGIVQTPNFHCSDYPGLSGIQDTAAASKRMTYILGPMGQLYNFAFKDNDYIDTRGYYNSTLALYGGDQSVAKGLRSYAFYYKAEGDLIANPYSRERFQVEKVQDLAVGEYLFANTDILAAYSDATYGLANTSYARTGSATASRNETPLGLGSLKKMLLLDDTNSVTNNTGSPTDAAGNAGNLRHPHDVTYKAAIDFNGTDVSITDIYLKEIQYCRFLVNQYGGNTYADRSKNQYISTNHYQPITDATGTAFTFDVYGGDTYVTYYDEEQIQFYWNQATALGGVYKVPMDNKLSTAFCFPVESTVNTEYRTGEHWAADRDSADMGFYESNSWKYNALWNTPNKTEEKFFAQDFLTSFVEEHPHQLWASDTKIDGELTDSWRSFKVANATEVNGIYGPINRVINFKNRLVFYQDKAFGIASINERSLIQDNSGQQLVLGTGGVFPNYDYVSVNTGSYHQFGVTASENAIYHYDARLKKLFQYSGGGATPLSEMKGMSAFFDNNVNGKILKADKTLATGSCGLAVGVHAVPDFRYNRVLFTFLRNYNTFDLSLNDPATLDYVIPVGSYVEYNGEMYYFADGLSVLIGNRLGDIIASGTSVDKSDLGFTISYSELLQAFESFYSYVPNIYLQYGRRLLSASPYERNKAYVHNEGEMVTYYDQTPYKSILHTILGENGQQNKVWNNLEYKAELYDSAGVDIYNETFDSIQFYNEYQDTSKIALNVSTSIIPAVGGGDIKRRMRTWRYTIPRDATDGKSRLRNPWMHCIMEFDNNLNKRHILHELIYAYSVTPM
tara:strand:- start:2417 stop:6907 length:4491 start_codon:yes stop_codon:yes gene_type:complete